MFNKTTVKDVGQIEVSIKDSDPYTQTNLVCFRRQDPLMGSKFEMFLTDEELVSLRDVIDSHIKEA